MSLKNKLLEGANKTLSVKHQKTAIVSEMSSVDRLTQQIQTDLSEMQEIQEFVQNKRARYLELRENVLKNLIYVRDHRKELGVSSFHTYLKTKIQITKGYFYEQVQAYELCTRFEKPALFREVDYKILVMIARIPDQDQQKRLLDRARELTRENFREVSQADSQDKILVPLVNIKSSGTRELHLVFSRDLRPEQKEALIQFVLQKSRELLG